MQMTEHLYINYHSTSHKFLKS